jgi:hypothetical protein
VGSDVELLGPDSVMPGSVGSAIVTVGYGFVKVETSNTLGGL